MKLSRLLCISALLMLCAPAWAQEPSVLIKKTKARLKPVSEILTVYGQVQPDPGQRADRLDVARCADHPGSGPSRAARTSRPDPAGIDHITECPHGISEGPWGGGSRPA